MQRTSFARSTRNWWRGLIPLAATWIATGAIMTDKIEHDLASRAIAGRIASNTSDAAGPWAAVQVSGRDVAVVGTAPAASSRSQVVAAVDGVWGVRLVNDRAGDIIAVHPFQWGAETDGDQLSLSGYVSPGPTRSAILKVAHQLFPAAKVADAMKDGGGAPADFAAITAFSLKQLARLTSGKSSLSDGSFSIRGAAATREAHDDVMAAAHALPKSLSLQSADITAPAAPVVIETSSVERPPVPSYVWLARRENNRVILSGFVPDQASHQALLAIAGQKFKGVTFDDKLKAIAAGAPGGFASAAEIGLTQLARLETGAATITDTQLTLVGLAESEEIAGSAKSEVAKTPAGFSGDATVVARPKPVQVAVAAPTGPATVASCTADLKSASAQGRIQFESWKSVILQDSLPVIDGIASILKRCPELKVEVSGHTDNTGRSATNKALSLRRAAAVITSLTKSGIDRSRLKAEGLGAARPVAKNETHQGRAANRRIEFTIVTTATGAANTTGSIK